MTPEVALSVAFMVLVIMLGLYLRGRTGWHRLYKDYPFAVSAFIGLVAGLFVSALNVAVLGIDPASTFFMTMFSTMTVMWIRRPI